MAQLSHPIRLTPTKMASDGRAVARDPSGRVLFVEGALPGETLDVEIVEQRSQWASARTVSVLEPSPDRVQAPCPHREEGCGGCGWQHVARPAQHRLKTSMIQEALARIGRLREVEVAPTVELDPWHWRTSIGAGVLDGCAALRRTASHQLVAIDGCLTAHPLLSSLLEGRRFGTATSVLLRCGARTGSRLASPRPRRARIDVPADVGRRYFYERAAGREWRVSAGSFFQGRADGADALADLVAGAAGNPRGAIRASADRAVDAYSGVGLFAGVLADLGWSVTALEGAASSVADARHNLAGQPVEVIRADVGKWNPKEADLVVADPSRSGLGRAGVDRLSATGASRIVLISCDAASLGRDAGLLATSGFALSSVTPVDLFPHTWRVEVVSVFDRKA